MLAAVDSYCQIDWLSKRLFVPFADFAVSLLVGALFLGPQSGQVGKLIQAEGPDSPRTLKKIDLLVNVARLDLLLLASIVFMMVTKVGE